MQVREPWLEIRVRYPHVPGPGLSRHNYLKQPTDHRNLTTFSLSLLIPPIVFPSGVSSPAFHQSTSTKSHHVSRQMTFSIINLKKSMRPGRLHHVSSVPPTGTFPTMRQLVLSTESKHPVSKNQSAFRPGVANREPVSGESVLQTRSVLSAPSLRLGFVVVRKRQNMSKASKATIVPPYGRCSPILDLASFRPLRKPGAGVLNSGSGCNHPHHNGVERIIYPAPEDFVSFFFFFPMCRAIIGKPVSVPRKLGLGRLFETTSCVEREKEASH
ncbi:hypothetical protein B0T13DRAFT_297166 [Neurospora crassa]|nr:hypothetical protein B0T13DRAFT_297166 [Neurospora crassa]